MALLLNWFPFERLPENIAGHAKGFGSWEELSAARPALDDAAAPPTKAMWIDGAPSLVMFGTELHLRMVGS